MCVRSGGSYFEHLLWQWHLSPVFVDSEIRHLTDYVRLWVGHGNMTNPRLKLSHEGAARVWHFQPRVVLFPCPTNDSVSYVLSYGQLQKSWIRSGLQWRNVNEYRLPSKDAHSPNYCSWLAVCVNCSANFYCKIPLINRFKLYLIKTYSNTSKNKLNVNENNVEYILRLH